MDPSTAATDKPASVPPGAASDGRGAVPAKVDEAAPGGVPAEGAPAGGDAGAEQANAKPGHLRALRGPARLSGAPSPSGGSRSPSGAGEAASSRDELDPDILLDKLGMRDLEPDATREEMQEMLRQHISSNSVSLPPLHERMSGDAVDDSRAFKDAVSKKSPDKPVPKEALKEAKAGISSRSLMESHEYLLRTLDEGSEGGDDGAREEENAGAVAPQDVPLAAGRRQSMVDILPPG